MFHKRQFHLAFTILVMIFIFLQSSLPGDLSEKESNLIVSALAEFLKTNPNLLSFIVRKCAHFTEYLILGISLIPTVTDYFKRHSKNWKDKLPVILLTAWVTGSLYAVTDELHQIFTFGRSCQIMDVIIDSAGVLTGALILFFRYKRRLKGHFLLN